MSSKVENPVVVEETQLVIDISKWNMKQFKKWQSVTLEANIDGMNAMLLQAIVVMPDGKPPSLEALDEILPAEWFVLAKAVGNSFNIIFRPQD